MFGLWQLLLPLLLGVAFIADAVATNCSNVITLESLQVDPSTQLVTVAASTSTRQDASLVGGSTSFLSIRDEVTDVEAFLCFDSVNINASVANYVCNNTFGDGFSAAQITSVPLSSLTSNYTDVATRFPYLVSNISARATSTVGLLPKLHTLSCDVGIFSNGVIVDREVFATKCTLCGAQDTATCSALAKITCSAPATFTRPSSFTPVRVESPAQWANATVAFNALMSPPPTWFSQSLCPSGTFLASGAAIVYTPVIGAGYGFTGNDVDGYQSGLGVLDYGKIQFSLACTASGAANEGCRVVPSVASMVTAAVSAVNVSRAVIVGCEVANRGTPPLFHPSLSRASPSESCRFALTESSSVVASVPSLSAFEDMKSEAAAALLVGPSATTMYIAAWCPSLTPLASTTTTATSSTPLQRYRVCTTSTFWEAMVVPLCRDGGFDDGVLMPLMSAEQVAAADSLSNASGNMSQSLLRLRCPSTYFPTQQLSEEFDSCDMAWVDHAALSTAASSSTTIPPCTTRYLQCNRIDSQQQERIDWIFGSTIFCVVFVGAMLLSTYTLRQERLQLMEPSGGAAGALTRRRSTRLRTRSSKPSEGGQLNLSNADVTDLILGDTLSSSARRGGGGSSRAGKRTSSHSSEGRRVSSDEGASTVNGGIDDDGTTVSAFPSRGMEVEL